MAKNNITQYDATAANNTDIDSINIAEGMAASDVNNAIRSLMSHLKNMDTGSQALTSPSFTAMSTDTINEKTSTNGVAIDSVTLKDGELGTTASPVPINSSSLNGGQFGGRRNVVLNGKFQIFQRGTSATTVSGNDVFVADRFKGWANGGGTYTVEQSTDTPNNEFEFSAKLNNTAVDSSVSAGDFYAYATDIEGHDVSQFAYGSSDAKSVTLSFWVKASLAGTYCIAFYSVTANRYQIKEYTISSANTWEKKTITIASGDTTGSWNRVNGNGLRIYWDLGSGSTYQGSPNAWASGQKFSTTNQANWIGTSSSNFYLTGVQVEIGLATPFEHRSIHEETLHCRRYYYEWSGLWIGLINNGNTSLIRHQLVFPVEMRGTPAVSNAGITSPWSIGTIATTTKTHNFEFSRTATADFRPFMGSPVWKFSAEL